MVSQIIENIKQELMKQEPEMRITKIIELNEENNYINIAVIVEDSDFVKTYAYSRNTMQFDEYCLTTNDMFKIAMELMKSKMISNHIL